MEDEYALDDGITESSNSQANKSYPINPKKVFEKLKTLKKAEIIKLTFSLFIIICFGIFNNIKIMPNTVPINHDDGTPEKKCYEDAIHNFLKFLNDFWIDNKYYCYFIEICGSLFLDTLFFISYIGWGIYSVDWRYGVSTMLFYGVRGILQQVVRMCNPDHVYFPDPGVPSAVVSYVQGSDYFFSGHCGFPIVIACEYYLMKKFKFVWFCIFVSIWEGFLMLNSREHYTIDLIVGPIFAHYICMMNFLWFKYIYKIKFLDKLKMKNREELKRIGVDFDVDESQNF